MAMDRKAPGGEASCVISGHCNAASAIADRARNQTRLARACAVHPDPPGTGWEMFPDVQVPHAALGARRAECSEPGRLDPGRRRRYEADAPGTLAAFGLG